MDEESRINEMLRDAIRLEQIFVQREVSSVSAGDFLGRRLVLDDKDVQSGC